MREMTNRQKILIAALHVFAHKGYTAGSLEQVAQQAHVSKSLIFHHFGNKEKLLEAALVELLEALLKVYMEPLSKLPPRENLRAMICISLTPSFWGEYLDIFNHVGALLYQPELPDSVRNRFKEFFHNTLKDIRELVEAAGIPQAQERGYLLAALLDGVQMHYMTSVDDYPILKVRDYVLKEFGLVPMSDEELEQLLQREDISL